MPTSFAIITESSVENEHGTETPIVIATCCKGHGRTEAYGTGGASIRCALAKLTEACNCGATFHKQPQIY